LQLYSGFVQDEITVVPERVEFTIGTKLEHNVYSGLEVEPSARLAWTPDARQTFWAAVSRAVRTPSRVDSDLFVPATPPFLLVGGTNFTSEKVLAYELGYRVRPVDRLSLSVATYYNFYDDVRSLEPLGSTNSFVIANGNRAESWGVELSGNYQVTDCWRLRGGYTFLHKNVTRKEGSLDLNRGRAEGNDPSHQVVIQSLLDLPYGFQLDGTARYVAELPDPEVPDYFTFDLRLAWRYKNNLELSIVGQNLWDNRHGEFGPPETRQQIPRSVYGKVSLQF
jgi:iron complex outermembrane receptor protein